MSEKMLPTICAIVVNWNQPDDTLACIQSLLAQQDVNLHVLLVDNGSSDQSVDIIQARYPQALFPAITLIASPANLKFGRGANLGMRHALAQGFEYVLLVNNDATLAPDGLKILLSYMDSDVGITAPLIYYAHPPDRIWSAGGKTNRWTLEKTNDYCDQPDPGNLPEIIEQDFVTGCCMLLHRQTLEQIGLFDEAFEFYYEDSDLCLRLRQARKKIRVIPQAKVWHKVSTSSGGSGSPNQRYWLARSSIYFFRKHARWWQTPVIVIWRIASALRTTGLLIRQRNRSSLQAYWHGLRDGIRGLR